MSPADLPRLARPPPWNCSGSSARIRHVEFTCVVAFQISASTANNETRVEEFLSEIPYKMAEPPWNYSGTLEKGLKVNDVDNNR